MKNSGIDPGKTGGKNRESTIDMEFTMEKSHAGHAYVYPTNFSGYIMGT